MYVHLPNRSLGYKTQLHDFHIPINNKGQLFSVLQMTHISFFLHKLSIWEQKQNIVQLIAIIIINLLVFFLI